MDSYRVMLDVPRDPIWSVSGPLAAHRRQIGTRRGTRRTGLLPEGAVRRCGSGIRVISRGSAAAPGCRSPRRTGTWTKLSRRRRPARRDCRSNWSAPWPKGCPTRSWTARSWTLTGAGRKPSAAGQGHLFVVRGEDALFRREHPGLFYLSGIPPWVSDVFLAMCMIRPRPGRMSWACRAVPGRHAGAGRSGLRRRRSRSMSRRRSPPGSKSCTLIPVHATRCRARYAAWASAASRFRPSAGKRSSMSLPARANRPHRPRRALPGAIEYKIIK